MCIYVKKFEKLSIADKDIVCYKELDLTSYKLFGPVYLTPFTLTPIYFMRKNKILRAKGKVLVTPTKHNNIVGVDKGLIHCYTTSNYYGFGRFQFKCIIPKGTEYIVSVNGGEIAAKKIKFIEKINI